MAEENTHYAHLLQPIRDLAANWNINIANELAEYLEVLESLTFSFKGGQSLNFAEAALVIQGSACVYSKKVEYLHSLVYQALEFVAERKIKAVRNKDGADGADDKDEFDDNELFLTLDDTLEEGTGIDLDEDDLPAYEPLPTRLPSTLLALEDAGTGQGDGDAGHYRIASCAVHYSGALLLEARDGMLLDDQLQPMRVAPTTITAPMLAAASHEDDYGDDFGADDHGFDDMDFGPAPMEDNDMPQTGGEMRQQEAGPGGAHVLEAAEEPEEEENEEFEPYKPLNPNDIGALASKPFKKSRNVSRKPKTKTAQAAVTGALLDGLLTLPAPTTSLLLPEFFYALAHADAALIRRSGSGGARRGAAQQVESAFSREEAEAGAAANDGVELDAADLGAAEEFFGDGYQDDDFGGPMDDDFEGFDAVPAQLAEPAPWTGRDAADGFDIDGQDNSYADMCRAHVEAYISAAAAAEVQTELATRVSAWRTKMAPVLEEEERRPEFDIHAYGDRVLSGLAALSVSAGGQPEGQPAGDDGSVMEAQPVTFKEVVAGAEVAAPCDVPRTFSSMLQLVNNGNLRIMKLGGSNQEFTVTLLNTVLPHKKIGEYRAPSSKEDLDMEGAVLGEATNHGGKQAAGKSSKRRKAA